MTSRSPGPSRTPGRCSRPHWTCVAALLLALVLMSSCSRVAEHPGGPPGENVAGPSRRPSIDAYVQTTVEVACLSRRVPDPRERVRAVWAIYRRHGFDDPTVYLEMTRTAGQQTAVRERIEQGIAHCP